MSKEGEEIKDQSVKEIYLGLGVNLGDGIKTIDAAISTLSSMPGIYCEAKSSMYRTEPIEANGPDFTNAVICIRTQLELFETMRLCWELEKNAARVRIYRNAPRPLDIDLLFARSANGPIYMNTPQLILPHPRFSKRAFVLVPWIEISGDWTLPGYEHSLGDFLKLCSDQKIEKIT